MNTFAIGGDLEVRRLGFGAMRIAGRASGGRRRNLTGARVLTPRRVELGINLIDTADSYGPEVSEELIAEALHPYPEGLVIATKGGLAAPARASGRPTRAPSTWGGCEGSLRRLRVERIDLYQLHAPDPEVPLEDSVGALKELQDEGKIRHIGLSKRPSRSCERARELVDVVLGPEPLQPRPTAGRRTCWTRLRGRASASSPGSRWPRAGWRGRGARWTRSRAATAPRRPGGARLAAPPLRR